MKKKVIKKVNVKQKPSKRKEVVKKKLSKFKVSEKTNKLIVLPEGKEIDFKYTLVENFAFAHLKWDKENKELVYNLEEPKLTNEEQKLYDQIIKGLLEILDIELSAIKKKEEAVSYIEEHVKKVVTEYNLNIKNDSFLKIMYFIYRNLIGLNQIEPLLRDPYIEDISCDGISIPLYIVHRKYGSIKSSIIYNDENDLREFIVKLAERCGRFVSYAEPLLDGSLPDGSRVQASFAGDVTTRGPSFTIRKFVEQPFSPIDLMNNGTANSDILSYLWMAVESGSSILVSGGAATGKTTFLNALSMFIPPAAKIVSVEDTRELQLPHNNWIASVTRTAFVKGYGEVTMFDLLKEAFRQSPDYVIVGEVRGQEAYVMFQGMAAGMPSIGTMHAGKVEDVIHRLETPPIDLSPTLLETLDIVIIMTHAKEKGENARRVKELVEIESVDPATGTARTNKVFNWLPSDDTFEYRGYSWLLQEIAKEKGVTIEDLQKEIANRRKVLDGMKKKGIANFKEVAKVLADYSKNPQSVLKSLS